MSVAVKPRVEKRGRPPLIPGSHIRETGGLVCPHCSNKIALEPFMELSQFRKHFQLHKTLNCKQRPGVFKPKGPPGIVSAVPSISSSASSLSSSSSSSVSIVSSPPLVIPSPPSEIKELPSVAPLAPLAEVQLPTWWKGSRSSIPFIPYGTDRVGNTCPVDCILMTLYLLLMPRRDYMGELQQVNSPLLRCFELLEQGHVDEARYFYSRSYHPSRAEQDDWWGDLEEWLFTPLLSKPPFRIIVREYRRCTASTTCPSTPASNSILANFVSLHDSPSAGASTSIPNVLQRLSLGSMVRTM